MLSLLSSKPCRKIVTAPMYMYVLRLFAPNTVYDRFERNCMFCYPFLNVTSQACVTCCLFITSSTLNIFHALISNVRAVTAKQSMLQSVTSSPC